MMKRSLIAAALATVLVSPALAQSSSPATMTKDTNGKADAVQNDTGGGFLHNQSMADWRGSKLIGAEVYGPGNTKIGDINDVVISNDGIVRAAVVGVGGFLGVGEKNVAIPFGALSITHKRDSDAIDKVTVSYTREQLNSAPEFAYYKSTKMLETTGENVTDKVRDTFKSMTDTKQK